MRLPRNNFSIFSAPEFEFVQARCGASLPAEQSLVEKSGVLLMLVSTVQFFKRDDRMFVDSEAAMKE